MTWSAPSVWAHVSLRSGLSTQTPATSQESIRSTAIAAMSATRQLGNRIAYASLVAELESLREAPTGFDLGPVGLPSAASVPVSRWEDDLVVSAPAGWASRDDGQRAPAVEVLELGSPRRGTR